MTRRKMDSFNRALDMLWDRERGGTLSGIALKYGVSTQRAGVILTQARSDRRIIDALNLRMEEEKKKCSW